MAAAVAAPSRAVLSRWLTSVTGETVGTQPEKKCANGVLYCQILESLRPGSINMTKVNLAADAEHSSLPNYRVLAVGLEKAGLMQPIDASQLSRGQPTATLDLLHRLYALSGPQQQGEKAESDDLEEQHMQK